MYFDNVGGKTLDVILALRRDDGRIAVCGTISDYNDAAGGYRLANFRQVLVHRLTVRGFLTPQYPSCVEEAKEVLCDWYRAGQLVVRESLATGLERVEEAFVHLITGTTVGKTLVRLSDSVTALPRSACPEDGQESD